jgi:hypothetical protein
MRRELYGVALPLPKAKLILDFSRRFYLRAIYRRNLRARGQPKQGKAFSILTDKSGNGERCVSFAWNFLSSHRSNREKGPGEDHLKISARPLLFTRGFGFYFTDTSSIRKDVINEMSVVARNCMRTV